MSDAPSTQPLQADATEASRYSGARIIAAEMRESLGTVVIDNRPGGGGRGLCPVVFAFRG